MSKKDMVILLVLVGLWLAWPQIDRKFIKPHFPSPPPPEEVTQTEDAPRSEQAAGVTTEPGKTPVLMARPDRPTAQEEPEQVEPREAEETVVLANDRLAVTVSSWGGGLKSVTLMDYPMNIEDDSPVVLDFESMRPLVYENLPGFLSGGSFSLQEDGSGRVLQLESTASSGLRVRRTLTLGAGYVVKIDDEWINIADSPITIADTSIQLGEMGQLKSAFVMRGLVPLGVDTLSPGGEKVQHWGKKIRKFFEKERDEKSLAKLPVEIVRSPYGEVQPVDWAAVKSQYFVQILRPERGGEDCDLYARRKLAPGEAETPSMNPRMQDLAEVSARIILPEITLEPGEKTTYQMTYYVGPKKYSDLVQLGYHQSDVMEFGMLPWIKVGLLRTMNAIYNVIPNYGIAIILLTVLIRILFWPVTHKSTESMKRMQEIQPLVNELRAKYKDNSQKQQQEIMALYKEHKVNPVGGCLPMVIQIPVFIALFVVLRGAIELRFASFLWIRDLSQPENLFAGILPLPLNILPLIMAGTMFWQQKLTPTAGDSQQAKMMAFMPVMMLVLFYKMPSGLVLYWTTNQCLMIVQQLVTKKRQAMKEEAE